MASDTNTSLKLNPRAKTAILKELRNPKNTQTTGKMRDPDKKNCFCAQGVIFEAFRKTHRKPQRFGWDDICLVADGQKEVCFLPQQVLKWLGVERSTDIQIEIDGTRESVLSHNDYYGHTFTQIADAIEEQL
jgi:hypothetical protein